MPNLRVFTERPADLTTRIYGSDGTSDLAVKTDSTGAVVVSSPMVVSDGGGSITVDGSVTATATDLDIRDLTPSTDNVRVSGQDATATNRVLRTDTSGIVQTMAQRRAFTEATESLTTADSYAGSTARDVSEQGQATFALLNTGANSATVKVQISPDGTNWLDDSGEVVVNAGSLDALTPSRFLRYVRLAQKSTTAGASTTLTLWFQAQV